MSKFDSMKKVELREMCRKHGVKNYGKMTNDGMRAALAAFDGNDAKTESRAFAQMFGTAPVVAPSPVSNSIKVVDGKKTQPKIAQPKIAQPREKAPMLPRVSCKGLKVQDGREERNGVKRRSEGGVCAAIWAVFDANPSIRAKDLQAIADANGWNRNNVTCEFYAWRKFMGIKGRSK